MNTIKPKMVYSKRGWSWNQQGYNSSLVHSTEVPCKLARSSAYPNNCVSESRARIACARLSYSALHTNLVSFLNPRSDASRRRSSELSRSLRLRVYKLASFDFTLEKPRLSAADPGTKINESYTR